MAISAQSMFHFEFKTISCYKPVKADVSVQVCWQEAAIESDELMCQCASHQTGKANGSV